MCVFVIRCMKSIDGEEESENFEVCYATEESAVNAALEDFNATKKDWEKDDVDLVEHIYKNDDGFMEFASFVDKKSGDYYNLYIDKLEIDN